ncbi:MAG: FtsX-like permease family protein [Betaproteobacteria bacterium]|nr:FtsX-like permease family protein [Betaproteobacteria bacterium]
MSALDRKLMRDFWNLRGQLLAVAVIVACGIAVFLTMRGMYEALVQERLTYYAENHFADVFARVKRAPLSLASRMASLPGVTAVETGITQEVTLDVPGLAEPATAQLVTLPPPGTGQLNQIFIRSGRAPLPDAANETLVSEAFARANSLVPGSSLGAVVNGRWERLQVVGIAISPEFIYVLRPASALPDDRRYGVLWMARPAVEHAFDMAGAFNSVALRLAADASESDVIDALDRLLDPYGSLGAYGRSDHLSDKVISDEINQDRVHGFLLSGIFLAVAAFIINMVLTRLVSTQRNHIGVLKAFGYGDWEVARHYLKLVLATLLVGALIGTLLAWWMGGVLVGIYREFFHFPHLSWSLSPSGLLVAAGACLVTALAGALFALRRVMDLPPAAAMLPEPPEQFTPTLAERLGLVRHWPITVRMILRNLERKPAKALLSVLGLSLAVALLVAGRYGVDALDLIVDLQFRAAQREDVLLEFASPHGADMEHALAHLPGVMTVETFRMVPVRLRFGHRVRRTAIAGLPPQGELRAVVDLDYRRLALPAEGIVLSSKLAESLGVKAGDRVTAESLEGRRDAQSFVVASLVDDLVGVSAYMPLDNLNRFTHEGHSVSGALLRVDPQFSAALYGLLKQLPAVSSVSVKQAMLDNFRNVIARTLQVQTLLNILFACVIAVGIGYNSLRIALSERSHELASLRVLGFTQREIAVILLGEQALITLAAVPVGFLIGFGICAAVAAAINATQEMFRMPLVLSSRTFAFALLVVTLAVAFSGILIWRQLQRLDLIAVLKTRE